MNWSAIIAIVTSVISDIPAIVKAWDSAPSNGLAKVGAVIANSPVVNDLANIGAQLFPKLSPTIHAAAAALVIAHPNNTSWIQSALNVLASSGYISLPAQLVVDGLYGPKTFAAVEAVQTKLGLPVTGFVADAEYNAIAALLSKL